MQDIYVISLLVVLALGLVTAILYLMGSASLDGDGDAVVIAPNGGFDIEAGIDIGDDFDPTVADMVGQDGDGGILSNAGDVPSRQRTPFIIRMLAFLAGFGAVGINASIWLSWAGLPGALAAFFAALAGGHLMRKLGQRLFLWILPHDITTAINISHMLRARGVVTDGTMTAIRPAQVRIRDCHGGLHHVMARCLDPQVSIAMGTEVILTRKLDPQSEKISYAAVPLT